MNIKKMLKQAQDMQKKFQEEVAEMTVEASSGGGMVTVTIKGTKEVVSLKIEPAAVDPDDVEMLQDLVIAALNEAHRKVDDTLQKQLGGMTGGLGIPGLE